MQMYDESRQRVLSPPPTSPCPSGDCGTCLTSKESSTTYAYVPGDIILGGVFSAHLTGANPFQCGSISEDTQLVQAFLYAVSRVSTLGTLRAGVKLGAVVFDDCSSSSYARSAVSNYLTNTVTLQDDKNEKIDQSKTFAFAGSGSDSVSFSLAELSSQLGFSLTGYKAQSHSLSEFPYYSSVISDDSSVINALLALLNRIGWTYLQLAYADDSLGEKFSKELLNRASHYRICFSSTKFTPHSNKTLLARNMTSNIFAKVIVLHAETPDAMEFLTALNRSSGASQYAVIATRNWMTSIAMEAFTRRLVFPILTIQPKSPSYQLFFNYLRSLTPTTQDTNPWFNEWYEKQMGCRINPSQLSSVPQCNDFQNTPITSSQNFLLHPGAIHVANAVLAAARGIDAALRYYCGSSYTSVCSALKQAQDKAAVMAAKMQNDSFVDDTGTINKMVDGISSTGFDYMLTFQSFTVKVRITSEVSSFLCPKSLNCFSELL